MSEEDDDVMHAEKLMVDELSNDVPESVPADSAPLNNLQLNYSEAMSSSEGRGPAMPSSE